MAEHELTVSFYLPGVTESSLAELPTFRLRVADNISVRALIESAASEFAATVGRKDAAEDIVKAANIVFSKPQVADDVWTAQQHDSVWGIRDDGSAVVADLEFGNVTVGEMLRAGEQGLLAGDPHHLIIAATGGRGLTPQDIEAIWNTFVLVIGFAKYGYEAAEAAGGLAEMRQGLSRRAARKYAKEWVINGFLPPDLARLIERKPVWKTAELAAFLRINAEDAQVLLGDCGYSFQPGRGEWVRGDDRDAIERRNKYKRMLGYMLSGDAEMTTRLSEEDAQETREEDSVEAEDLNVDHHEPPVSQADKQSGEGPKEK